ncbi:MAG: MogA/MoaB family molybdenum cofactor biosynthesis protein [Deltaproteobacteria bacterium]|nr:MogA/MoaB family molybdenum cofactor biosynthesis protein [Deltaproteobacteria bacterium]
MAHAAPRKARVYVLTVSDTRTPDDDESGRTLRTMAEGAGHEVVGYGVLPDEPDQVRARCRALCESAGVDAILTSGGTGIAGRDTTYEAIAGLLEKTLPGFGELFRFLSYQEIGSKALASRAVAGTRGEVLIFAMPGSTKAVRLAMEKLIAPELGHLVGELKKK